MRAILFLISAAVSAPALAADIPLDSVWALHIPNTQDVGRLDASRISQPRDETELIRSSLVLQISRVLAATPENVGTAFVVSATGEDALRRARDVLTGDAEREKTVEHGELTLVFYSHRTGRSLRLDSIRQDGNEVEIQYHLDASEGGRATTPFALIPLGKISSGKARVTVTALPDTGAAHLVARYKERPRQVCESFQFEVKD